MELPSGWITSGSIKNGTTASGETVSSVAGPAGIGFNLDDDLNFDIGGKKLVNVALPENDGDVCTKKYVTEKIIEDNILDATAIQNSANTIGAQITALNTTQAGVYDDKILPAYNHSVEEHFEPQLFQDHLTAHFAGTYSSDWTEEDTNNPKFIQNKPDLENYVTKTNPIINNLKVEGDFEATGFKITQSDIVYNNRTWATQYNSDPVDNIVFNMKSPNVFNVRSISLTLEASKISDGSRCGADDVTVILSINSVVKVQLNNYKFTSWGLNTIAIADVNNPIQINANDIIQIEMINNSADRKIVTKFQDKIDAEFISLNMDGDLSIEKMIELRLVGIEIDTSTILATEWDEGEGRHILNVSERLKLGAFDNVETEMNTMSDRIDSVELNNTNQDIFIADHSTRITNLEAAGGTDLTPLENRITTVEGTSNTNSGTITNINSTLGNHTTSITGLNTTVNPFMGYFNTIKEKFNKMLELHSVIGHMAAQFQTTGPAAIPNGQLTTHIPFEAGSNISGYVEGLTNASTGKMLILKDCLFLIEANLYFDNSLDVSNTGSLNLAIAVNGESNWMQTVRSHETAPTFTINSSKLMNLYANDEIQLVMDHNNRDGLTHGNNTYYTHSSWSLTIIQPKEMNSLSPISDY